jgi:hypothetical protein
MHILYNKLIRFSCRTAITVALTIGAGPAVGQQFVVNPASVTIEVGIDSQELSGQAGPYPERAEWYSADPQIAELSYPVYLHYAAPAAGMPHISHVIRVKCLKEGEVTVTGMPLDLALQDATATVSCKETQPQPPEPPDGLPPQNVEDCAGVREGATLKWKTPIDDANFPNCGTAVTCELVINKTICAALNSFVSIRDDNNDGDANDIADKKCSECHYRNLGSTYSPDVARYSSGGVNREDFAPRYADSFLTKDVMGSPAYKEVYLRRLIQKWKDDGYE